MTDLSEALKPNMDGEKTVLVKMIPGKRPDVTFTGFWTGNYVRSAMDSIAKAYRLRRRGVKTPSLNVVGAQTQQKAEGRK